MNNLSSRSCVPLRRTPFAAMFIVPFLYMISISFRPNMEILTFPISLIPEEPGMGAFTSLFAGTAMTNWIFNSFLVTITVTLLQLFTSSMAGYGFARGDFPGKDIIFWLLMSAIMIPFTVTMIPSYILIARLQWIDTFYALIIPAATSIFGTFLCRQFILTIPRTYDDAAIVDGCSVWGVYYRIHLPLMTPVLATLGVLAFLGTWNDFVWPLLVLQSNTMKTISVGLASMLTYQGGASIRMAGATVTFLPTLIVFILLQRYVIRGFVLSGLKG
ncbi:MAG: carbohydrate ABC transporter permease [Chloroflexi bacterium]|nr:carbohydrate ABC transporter permease [Chloroflexota bacterium]